MIDFSEIDSRLSDIDKSRAWLAEVTKRSPESIRAALAPNAPPTKRSPLLQRVLSDAIEREEISQGKHLPEPPPGYSAIFLNDAQLDRADRASRTGPWESLAEFCREAIMTRVDELLGASTPAAAPTNILSLEAAEPRHWIDLLGGVAAGAPADIVMSEPIQVAKGYHDDHYALRVFGRSMEPKIKDGSTIIVKRWGSDKGFPKKGTIVIYSDGSGSTLKEFGYRKAKGDEEADAMGNVAVLRSLNPEFPEVQTMEGGRIDALFVESL